MNKNFKLAALSALTLLGGSWVAAQQEDSARLPTAQDESQRPYSPAQSTEAGRPAEAPRASGGASSARNSTRAPRGQRPASPESVWLDRGFAPAADVLAQVHEVHRMGPMSPEEAARMRAFQDAIRELRTAKSDDDKEAARKEVTALVSEQLDADLESREQELAAIEQRAKELRKQLDERKTAKPELLKMLVMLIDNPQVGLGIPPEWMQMLMRGQQTPNRTIQTFGFTTPDPQFYSISPLERSTPVPPAQPGRPSEPTDATRY